MQISLEKPSALERRLTVALPEERIAGAVHTRLENLRKTARIDGFRLGKAPLSVVRRQFGARVRDEIVGELLQQSFSEAMSQEALRAAGQPVIDPVMAAPGQGLTYTATFEVFPDVVLAPLENLELIRPECTIGEADIDAMTEKLREQHKEWVAVERPARDGDKLSIDYRGKVGGEEFAGGTGEDVDLILGSGTMIEGFESGLRGQAAGATVTLAVEFPADYRNDALAGKAATFEVTIKRVAEPLLPAVDDAFFTRFGVAQGGLPAFRAEVRANMEKERDRALRQRFTAEVMERVSAANDFELPASLIENEAQRLRQQVARDLIMRGVNPNQAGEQLERTVRERARQRVKLGLVMAEIVKTAQLRADPSKVRQRIEALASSYEDAPAVVKWYYENPEQLQQVEAMCLEDEAVDWIASRAQVKTALVSFDALLNPVQTGAQPEAST